MSNTKFIKVDVSERMPIKKGMYIVIFKNNKVGKFNFWNEEAFKESWNEHVNFWLEEVPDRESELIEMLEFALNRLENTTEYEVVDFYKEDCAKIKALIQSVKQPK